MKKAEKLVAEGRKMLKDGRIDDALLALKAAAKADEGSVQANYLAGVACMKKGDRENAASYFKRAEELDPTLRRRAFEAFATRMGGEPAKALEQLDKVIASEPGATWARMIKGQHLIRTGRLEDAAKEFKSVVKKEPGFADGWMSLGRAYMRMRQPKNAVKYFRKAHAIKPSERLEDFIGKVERGEIITAACVKCGSMNLMPVAKDGVLQKTAKCADCGHVSRPVAFRKK